MELFERYFQRNIVAGMPDFPDSLKLMVIIPVYDDPDIFETLESLLACDRTGGNAGVLVVVNHSEAVALDVKQRNRSLAQELRDWMKKNASSSLYFELVEAFDLPVKFAGVGLARKIAMDKAAFFFHSLGHAEYPIASLDADTLVEPNYIKEVIRYFETNPVAGVSINYAHRLDESEDQRTREAMIRYELYLRYYEQALRYTGHPHFWTCIGSAFAVRVADYVAQGGMNKRQAGEDFYFLQKMIATGRYSALTTTSVYPSPRFSERTPFGTGQSLRQILETGGEYLTYDFQAFADLKLFFENVLSLYKSVPEHCVGYFDKQAEGLRQFLIETAFAAEIMEINANCASPVRFIKHFYDHFNAFRVLKYLNFVHASYYMKKDITSVVPALFSELNVVCGTNPEEMLNKIRKM